MSARIDNQNRDIFDFALIYNAELPKIKEAITNAALVEAQNSNQKWEDWTNSRIARKLTENAYATFKKVVKEKYSRPDFDYFLDCSIQKQYSYFYNELLPLITQALQNVRSENTDLETGAQ